MINTFFQRPAVRQRITSGLLGAYLHGLAQALQAQGSAPTPIRYSLSAGDKFGRWLGAQQLPLPAVPDATLARYLRHIGHRSKAAQGLGRVGRYLRQHGVAFPPAPPAPLSVQDQGLCCSADSLLHVRGRAANTREISLRIARRFLTSGLPTEQGTWQTVTAEHIGTCVQHEVERRHGQGRQAPAVAMRALLRFVVFAGERAPGLAGAVPTPRQGPPAALPGQLTAEEVERMLMSSQGESLAALRNHAIVLLLARLGMRAREVARVR
jgi:integrase/recombinase XerD